MEGALNKKDAKYDHGSLISMVDVMCVGFSVAAAFEFVNNSISSFIWQIWKSSGDYIQIQWNKIIDITGENPFILYCICPMIITSTVYWTLGGIFMVFDYTNKPKFMIKYKVEPEPYKWDSKIIKKVIKIVLFNQFVVSLLISSPIISFATSLGLPSARTLPTFKEFCIDLALNVVLYEMLFYYSHRLLHSKYLYKRVHKRHHELEVPIAIATVYAHPLEYILSNIIPVTTPQIIRRTSSFSLWLWTTIVIIKSVCDHSGYHLPFMPCSEAHDFHHRKFECFGVIGLMDKIHSTNRVFSKTKGAERHTLLYGLASARELYPD